MFIIILGTEKKKKILFSHTQNNIWWWDIEPWIGASQSCSTRVQDRYNITTTFEITSIRKMQDH